MTETELAALTNVEKILNWMKTRNLDLATMDLVAQDEFAHDLIVPLPQGNFLVFGVS